MKQKTVLLCSIIAVAMMGACNNFFHDLVPPNGDRITSFKVPGQVRAAVISDNTITVTVQEGTNIRGLLPEIAVSPRAKALPVTFNYIQLAFPSENVVRVAMDLYTTDDPSAYIEDLIRHNPDFNIPRFNMPIDFSAPVDMFVVAARGSIRQYTVYVIEENAGNGGFEGADWPRLLGLGFSKADNPGLLDDALCWIFEDSRTIAAIAKYPPESAFSYALIPSFVILGDRLEVDGAEIISGQSSIQFDAEPGKQTKTFTVWRDGSSVNYTLDIVFTEDMGADGPMLMGLRFTKYDNPELVIDAVCRISENSQTISARAFYPVEMPYLSFALISSFDILGERLEVDGAEVYSADENSVIQFTRFLGTQNKTFTVWRNGKSKDYTLTITFEEDPDTVRSITDFRFVKQDNPGIAANAVAAIINTDNTGTISLQVFYSGAQPSVLIPRFVSPGTVSVSGATQTTGASSQNFSAPIDYRVVSRNGQYVRTYTVKTEFISLTNAAPRITSFNFSQSLNSALVRDSNGEIHDDTGFIIVNVYYGGTFAPELLTPEFNAEGMVQVMGSMQVSAASPQDFSRPIQYTVIHPTNSLLRRDYWVQAHLIQDNSAHAIITELSFHPDDNPGLRDDLKARIDQLTGKITVYAPIGSGITARIMYPRFTAAGQVNVNGSVQTSGASGQMFSSPVVYTVVSANGLNRRDYTVEVRELTSTMYVNQNAFGAGDGTSWENAFRYLQNACEAAAEFPEDMPVEIWIAAGTYTPGNTADDYLPLAPNTSYIGGFAGYETAKSQRNIAVNTVTISGNLGAGAYSKRLFASAAELNGNLSFESLRFTGIRGTAAGDAGIAALLNAASEIAVTDCDFSDLETAAGTGAAVYAGGGRAVIAQSAFTACRGGAVYAQGASAHISGVTSSGGGYGTVITLNCTGETEIKQVSVADYSGTAVYLGGNGNKTLETVTISRGGTGLSVLNTAGNFRANDINLQDLSGQGVYLTGVNGVKYLSGITGQGISGSVISCTNAGSGPFTLTGGNFDNTGSIALNGASVTVLNTGITNSKAASALDITASGNTIIDALTIDGVPNGRGVNLVTNGSAAISNTHIKNCTTTANGGGMYISGSGSANISYTTITGCKAGSYGGGMYLACSGEVFIFNNNTAVIDGAGLTASSGYGGGIYRTGGSLRVENSAIKNISGNGNNCAGIYHSAASANFVINGLELMNISGYGIYTSSGSSNISGITAANIGGAYGVYSSDGSFTLTDSRFNTCAVYSRATGTAPIQVTGTDIFNAPAASALDITASGNTVIDWVTIDGVPNRGGMGISSNSTVQISNLTVKNASWGISLTGNGTKYLSGITGRNISGRAIYCTGANSFTLTDGDFDHTGNVAVNGNSITILDTGITNSTTSDFVLDITANGNAVIDTVTIDGIPNGWGGMGIYSNSTSTFQISNSTIKNVNGSNGYGIYISANSTSTFQISNSTLKNINRQGIYSSRCGLIIFENTIVEHCGNSGVYLNDSGDFTMNGGTISDNTAVYGGGVYLSSGNFTMNGGMISGNTAVYGGGVYSNTGNFIMNSGTISGNTSECSGGGVNLTIGNFTMNGGTVSGNTAEPSGGGVYLSSGSFTMNDGTISGNTVHTINNIGGSPFGGGVCLNGGTFTMRGGVISGNSMEVTLSGNCFGGGVGLNGGTFIMENGTITGNSINHLVGASNAFGGGVCVWGSTSIFEMRGGIISRNTVTKNQSGSAYGGGVAALGSITKTGGTIFGNDSAAGADANRCSGITSNYGQAVYINTTRYVNTTLGPANNYSYP